MNNFQLKSVLLSAAVASALSACGGGAVSPFTGGVFDGKLIGATVICDANDNGNFDTGEAIATTDGNGNFTFKDGCWSPIAAYGGTNADTGKAFLGALNAPLSSSGSSYVTPLTTLMQAGNLSAAQLAAALSLPAGTDPTQVDPATSVAVHAATVAVQQIIQQTVYAIAAAAGVPLSSNATSSATTQALYALVANEVAKLLPSTVLITASGATATVPAAVVSTIVANSVSAAKAATATLPAIATGLTVTNNISAASVAALTATAIASQAQSLASATSQGGLTTLVNTLQPSTAVTAAVTALLPVLSAAHASNPTVITNLGAAATAVASADAAAFNAAATAAAIAAGTSAPSAVSFAAANYLAIVNDTVSLNGASYTLASFKGAGVTVASPVQGSLETIGFTLGVNGTPFTAITASLGLEAKDATRVLQMVIDRVDLTLNAGHVTVSIPASARLYVYGKITSGTSANLTLANLSANTMTIANNAVSFNAGTILDKAIAQLGSGNSVFSTIRNAKGTFDVKFALTNVDIYTGVPATPVPADAQTIQVTNTSVIVTGKGAAGTVTVQ